MDPMPTVNLQPLVHVSSLRKSSFYNRSDPFPRPKLPVCAGLFEPLENALIVVSEQGGCSLNAALEEEVRDHKA